MRGQARWILDLDLNDHVAPFRRLFTLRHALVREGFLEAGSCRAATANDLLPAVDGGYGTFPACERFLEVEFDHRFEVISITGEDGVGFLSYI